MVIVSNIKKDFFIICQINNPTITIRDGSGQNPTRDLTRPEGVLANPTRPEKFFQGPVPTRSNIFVTRDKFGLTRVTRS